MSLPPPMKPETSPEDLKKGAAVLTLQAALGDYSAGQEVRVGNAGRWRGGTLTVYYVNGVAFGITKDGLFPIDDKRRGAATAFCKLPKEVFKTEYEIAYRIASSRGALSF